jgi:hypothetical protein
MRSVGDGGRTPDELGVTPGLSVGCTRGSIVTGACTPTICRFDTFGVSDCSAS